MHGSRVCYEACQRDMQIIRRHTHQQLRGSVAARSNATEKSENIVKNSEDLWGHVSIGYPTEQQAQCELNDALAFRSGRSDRNFITLTVHDVQFCHRTEIRKHKSGSHW